MTHTESHARRLATILRGSYDDAVTRGEYVVAPGRGRTTCYLVVLADGDVRLHLTGYAYNEHTQVQVEFNHDADDDGVRAQVRAMLDTATSRYREHVHGLIASEVNKIAASQSEILRLESMI